MVFDKSLNYAWIFKALDNLNDNGVAVFILPNSILTSDADKKYREYLIDNDLIDTVVTVPNKFFINTDISTTVIKISKNKPDHRKGKVTLIKSKPTGLFERKQKGEDHMKTRVYTKTFLTFTDEDLVEIAEAIKKQTSEKEFSKTVTNEEIKKKEYTISPSEYIGLKPMEDTSRSFKDIINDIKRCDTRRGLVKLTINQTLAQQFNIESVNAHPYVEMGDDERDDASVAMYANGIDGL
jgi:type I restriction enzyme M protein